MSNKFTEELDQALARLAKELIEYDQYMIKAGAPNIRFIHKHTSRAKADIKALLRTYRPEKQKSYLASSYRIGFNEAISEVSKAYGLED